MWVSGWTCHWAGPDDFLGMFAYVGGSPSPEFSYRNDALDQAMTAARSAVNDTAAQTQWQKAQDLVAADMPTVPLVDVMPQAGAKTYVVGFVGSGLGLEDFDSVWLNE
jgi:ABC-type transport system substrate-binding protein